jgi:hypothetical protein
VPAILHRRCLGITKSEPDVIPLLASLEILEARHEGEVLVFVFFLVKPESMVQQFARQ